MKQLILNPSEEQQASLRMIGLDELLTALVRKVTRQVDSGRFTKCLVSDWTVRLFISNVQPLAIGVQNYSGDTLGSEEEAKEFFLGLGQKLYGNHWTDKLIIQEIEFSRNRDEVFGLSTQDQRLIKSITEELNGYCQVSHATAESLSPDPSTESQKSTESSNPKKNASKAKGKRNEQ
jgi:hypothetical protein